MSGCLNKEPVHFGRLGIVQALLGKALLFSTEQG